MYKIFKALTNGTASFKDYIRNIIIPPAQNLLQASLRVQRLTANLTFYESSKICNKEIVTPTIYRTGGVEADLVIFVTAMNDPSLTFLAFAESCVLNPVNKRYKYPT